MVILTSVRRAVAVRSRDAGAQARRRTGASQLTLCAHPNQTVGAIMFIDESSAGLRAVLAGTAPIVAVARELVQAKLLEAAAWCEPATPQVAAPRAVEDDDWVHWTHQVPLSLVGLLIGVGGNTIREMEHDTRCHLSLDRSRVHTDGPVPYLFLHIHGSQQGAAKAVSRCTDLLQRHVETLAVKSWAQQQQQQQQWAAAPAEAEELTCQAAPAWDVSAEAAWGGPMSCEVPWDAVGSASATPDGSHRISPGTPAVDGMAGVSKLALRSRWLREHHTSGSDEDGSMQ